MARGIKGLLHKREDPSLSPQHPHKARYKSACLHSGTPAGRWEVETGESMGLIGP